MHCTIRWAFSSVAAGDNSRHMSHQPGFTEKVSESFTAPIMQIIVIATSLCIDSDIHQRLPTQLTFTPKLAQAVVFEPVGKISLIEAAHFSPTMVLFAYHYAFRCICQRINQQIGMGRHHKLAPLRGFAKQVAQRKKKIRMQSNSGSSMQISGGGFGWQRIAKRHK